ncbi:MAG TPA: sugar kinase [Geminicoccus sp.]|uniref:carbohydrate kinase family protein n=1 Tax=Geminicoccus sp. TaxID=2024832 RepID=UPI002D1BEA28|nr:sugar kinase [Geminicoccus sp.]HWL70463.1 sugar kinase [Geminicoccus sp.]
MGYDAAAVGFYTLDILARPVEAIPDGGGVAFVDQIRMVVSGTAGAVAIDLAKLGLHTLAAGSVGDDEQGGFVLDRLARHGVDISAMQRIAGVPTSTTIMTVRPNGERPALHMRGAADHFELPPERYAQLLDARFVHLGGTGFMRRFDGAPSLRFLQAAKAAGCRTSLDLIAPGEDGLALVGPLLPFVDYFMPSIEEARALSGMDDPLAAARFFLDRGAGTVAVTLGAGGSVVADAGGAVLRIPAFDVPVVDTTGCGDAYVAGMIAGLARGMDLETAARLATAASGLVATGLGSDAGIVDLADTLQRMQVLPARR